MVLRPRRGSRNRLKHNFGGCNWQEAFATLYTKIIGAKDLSDFNAIALKVATLPVKT